MNSKKINAYDVIMMILHTDAENLIGRTVLQKLVYFWSITISHIDGIDFQPYYYGPYSPQLRYTLEKMISYSFLDEDMKTGSIYGAYNYELSDSGKELAGRAKKKYPEEFKQMKEIIDKCKDLFSLRAYELASATKIHYLVNNAAKTSYARDNIIDDAQDLGWTMTKNNVNDGIKLLEELGLIKSRDSSHIFIPQDNT